MLGRLRRAQPSPAAHLSPAEHLTPPFPAPRPWLPGGFPVGGRARGPGQRAGGPESGRGQSRASPPPARPQGGDGRPPAGRGSRGSCPAALRLCLGGWNISLLWHPRGSLSLTAGGDRLVPQRPARHGPSAPVAPPSAPSMPERGTLTRSLCGRNAQIRRGMRKTATTEWQRSKRMWPISSEKER